MSARRTASNLLRRLAFAHKVLGQTGHRVRAYERAADAIFSLPGELKALRDSGELAATPGIGPSILSIVDAVLAGERPQALVDIEASVPVGVLDMARVAGLGPKRIRVLWTQLGLTSLAEVQYACRENRLLTLDGFGPALQDKVFASVTELLRANEFVRVDQAWRAVAELRTDDPDLRVVGELGRAEELIRCVEVVSERIVAGPTHVDGVPVRVVAGPLPPVALWWLTADPSHRSAVVEHAKRRGLRLDETGLFKKRKRVDVAGEAGLYAALDLAVVPVEQRWGSVLKRDAHTPALVTRQDLRGALHNHTTASDGRGTLEQMQVAAHERGLSYLGISDHSPHAWYANGLEPSRLAEQVAAIQGLPDHPCTLLTGVEADILADGTLDHPSEVLDPLDVVVASIHDRAGHGGAAITQRLVHAASAANILGHPTGRLLLGRPASDIDIDAVIAACATSGCALELNASPQRLDLCTEHLQAARDAGVLISIAADAHAPGELDNLQFGVNLARRAGLTAAQVLNTQPAADVRAWARTRTNPG